SRLFAGVSKKNHCVLNPAKPYYRVAILSIAASFSLKILPFSNLFLNLTFMGGLNEFEYI
ncbi:MAG: hypothetical protein PVI62_19030, partial [Desulfobacterales bacterium]